MAGRFISSTAAVLMAVLTLASCSSSDRGKVIPPSRMEKIYREMFIADQWVSVSPERRNRADTTWLYRPIFEKYGYTYQDYLATVGEMLNDPERFAGLVAKVTSELQKEAGNYRKAYEREERLAHRRDSIAALANSFASGLPLYEDLFMVPSMTDRIEVALNEEGVYYPVPVLEDTMFFGPRMVFADSLRTLSDSSDVKDTLHAGPSEHKALLPAGGVKEPDKVPASKIIGPDGIKIIDDEPWLPVQGQKKARHIRNRKK